MSHQKTCESKTHVWLNIVTQRKFQFTYLGRKIILGSMCVLVPFEIKFRWIWYQSYAKFFDSNTINFRCGKNQFWFREEKKNCIATTNSFNSVLLQTLCHTQSTICLRTSWTFFFWITWIKQFTKINSEHMFDPFQCWQ